MTREEREAYFIACRHEGEHRTPDAHNRKPQQTSMRNLRSRRVRRTFHLIELNMTEQAARTVADLYWDTRSVAYRFRGNAELAAVPCEEHSLLLSTAGDAPCPSTALADALMAAGISLGVAAKAA